MRRTLSDLLRLWRFSSGVFFGWLWPFLIAGIVIGLAGFDILGRSTVIFGLVFAGWRAFRDTIEEDHDGDGRV